MSVAAGLKAVPAGVHCEKRRGSLSRYHAVVLILFPADSCRANFIGNSQQKLSKEEHQQRNYHLIVHRAVFESIVLETKDMTDGGTTTLLTLCTINGIHNIAGQQNMA